MANSYAYVKRSVQARRKWLESLKDKPCADCGKKYISCVMEWHHLDPKLKSFQLGQGSFRYSRELILKEIEKCVLLCANCHRIREYGPKSDKILDAGVIGNMADFESVR